MRVEVASVEESTKRPSERREGHDSNDLEHDLDPAHLSGHLAKRGSTTQKLLRRPLKRIGRRLNSSRAPRKSKAGHECAGDVSNHQDGSQYCDPGIQAPMNGCRPRQL